MVRNITKSDFLAHTHPLFQQLKLLDFESTRKLSLAQYIYKNRNVILPPLLPNHNYQTRNRQKVRLPERNNVLFEKSYLYQGPKVWNILVENCPTNVLNAPSIHSFKRKLKKYLLSIQ